MTEARLGLMAIGTMLGLVLASVATVVGCGSTDPSSPARQPAAAARSAELPSAAPEEASLPTGGADRGAALEEAERSRHSRERPTR